jgi:arsenate reductase
MKKFTIYHNPHCSKSRETLALLRDHHIEPDIVLYLDTPPDANTLKSLLTRLQLTPRNLLRTSEPEYKTLKLGDTTLSDDVLIKAMIAHPTLIQRPIVTTDKKAAIGRPPENVLELIA